VLSRDCVLSGHGTNLDALGYVLWLGISVFKLTVHGDHCFYDA